MTLPNRPHILYAEDHPDTSACMELLLQQAGLAVAVVPTAAAVWELAQEQDFDLFLLDYVLSDASGLTLCQRLRERFSETPIVFYTGYAHPDDKALGLAAGATAYYSKPYEPYLLIQHLKYLIASKPTL
jgi:DNA-binding response OmpR family regulator